MIPIRGVTIKIECQDLDEDFVPDRKAYERRQPGEYARLVRLLEDWRNGKSSAAFGFCAVVVRDGDTPDKSTEGWHCSYRTPLLPREQALEKASEWLSKVLTSIARGEDVVVHHVWSVPNV